MRSGAPGGGCPCPPGPWSLADRFSRSGRDPWGFRGGRGHGGIHLALEQAPEVIPGQGQPQVLIRAASLPLPAPEHPRVPVQPLQIQHPLSERPMPTLVHPQHAVPALHGAAGSDRPAQHRRHLAVRRPPVGVELLTEQPAAPAAPPCHSPHQPGGSSPGVAAGAATTSGPRRTPLRGQRQFAQLTVQPIQERQRRRCFEEPADLGPLADPTTPAMPRRSGLWAQDRSLS